MLKLSKTAIRELSKMYRAVLMGAMVTLIATGAQAADGDLTIATDGTVTGTNTSGTEITLNTSEMLTSSSALDGANLTDGSVGKDALSTTVQTSLGKADSALQKADITTGATNGTISIDGTDVAVNGLGSAAYTDSTAYATAAQGALADSALQKTDITTGTANGTISVDGADVAVKGLGSAAYTDSTAYATAAQGALADSALQKADITTGATNGTISVDGTNVAVKGLGSAAYTDSTSYATAAQGALADTALQNGDNAQFNTLQTTGDATIGGDLNVGTSIVMTENYPDPDYADYSVLSVGSNMKNGIIEISGKDYSYISLNGEDGSILGSGQVGSSKALQVIADEPATQDPYDYRAVFEADNSGNITNEGTITSGGLITAKGGITTASTDASTGTTTYGGATLGDTTVNGDLTVKNGEDFTLGGTAVNAIDKTGVNRNAPGDETTLTTTSSVVNTIQNQAEDATYTNTVTNNSNVTANTLNGAIANLDNAIGDRTLTSSNGSINTGMATSLSAGLQAAGNAIGSLNYSSTNYVQAGSDLTTAISALDNQLYQLNNSYNDLNEEVRDMNKEMKAGFASVAALSGLQPNARAFNDTQISVGVGNYRGQTGFALGGFHYVNDNLMLNLGAAYAGERSATFRGGLTFGW